MKVLFTLASPGAFVFYDEVARELCRRAHEVNIFHRPNLKASLTDHALRSAQEDTANCVSGIMRKAALWKLLSDPRELRGCGVYFNPNHPSPWLEKRWEKKLSRQLQSLIQVEPIRKLLFSQRIQNALCKWEEWLGPDRAITRELQEMRPNVVVASPYIYSHSLEVDYLKAAKKLGIPTIAVVQSWDNLTTKGTYNVLPDYLIVWNQPLADEAVTIHGMPREKIIITGAPRFDAWFATCSSRSRADFCRQLGIDPQQEYLVYMCSSYSIAGDETDFVREFSQALSRNVSTQNLFIILRPYPSNAVIWEDINLDNLVVWPPGGAIPDMPETRQDFFDTLYYSVAAVGVNTTAFLEAAIVDKPCVTIFSSHYQRTHIESAHFQHLRKADFIETAQGFAESAELLGAIIKGADIKSENRRRFVHDFIRPRGVDKPASPIMADVIETVAQRLPV